MGTDILSPKVTRSLSGVTRTGYMCLSFCAGAATLLLTSSASESECEHYGVWYLMSTWGSELESCFQIAVSVSIGLTQSLFV